MRPASIRRSSGPSSSASIIKQVLVDGFFHGDPHPGNILADPTSKRIIFLDLGLVGQLNAQQRVDLLGLIYSIKEVDIQGIGDGLIALGTPMRSFDEPGFRSDIDRLARQYLIYGKASSLGGALSAFLGAVFDNGLRLDSQLTLAMKAVIQAEETARALSFDIDLGEAAVTEARAALLEQFTPENIQKQVQGSAVRIGKELARRVPSLEGAALSWLDQFNKGKFVVEVDTKGLERSISSVSAHRSPGDGRDHRGRAADRDRDRHGGPAPAVADRVPGGRLHRDDRLRGDPHRQLRGPVPAVLRASPTTIAEGGPDDQRPSPGRGLSFAGERLGDRDGYCDIGVLRRARRARP